MSRSTIKISTKRIGTLSTNSKQRGKESVRTKGIFKRKWFGLRRLSMICRPNVNTKSCFGKNSAKSSNITYTRRKKG